MQILKHELQLRKWKYKLSKSIAVEEKPVSPEQSASDMAVSDVPVEFDIAALPERAIMQVGGTLVNVGRPCGLWRTCQLSEHVMPATPSFINYLFTSAFLL